MAEPRWETEEDCGCKRAGHYAQPCRFHWNESNIQMELGRARQWEHGARLDSDDPADRQVLRFYEHLCYWAAKGIGEAGSVGSIHSAAYKRNKTRP